mmetsp:Transcript_31774/g.68101  ORF Transcript_31774/g.68101 Transcript_31774/m.68101 type:complete len:536 (-) Transcript_31774:23-1630(-)
MAEILDLTCTTRDGTCADLFEDVRVQHYNSEIFVDASASQQEIAIRNLSSPPTFFPQLSPKVSGIQSMGSSDRAQPHVQQQQQQQQQPADDAFVRHVKSDGTSGTKSRVLLDGSDLPVLRSVSDMFQGVDSAAHRAHNETAKLLHEISQLQNLQQDIDRLQAFFQGNGDVLPTVQQQQQEPQQDHPQHHHHQTLHQIHGPAQRHRCMPLEAPRLPPGVLQPKAPVEPPTLPPGSLGQHSKQAMMPSEPPMLPLSMRTTMPALTPSSITRHSTQNMMPSEPPSMPPTLPSRSQHKIDSIYDCLDRAWEAELSQRLLESMDRNIQNEHGCSPTMSRTPTMSPVSDRSRSNSVAGLSCNDMENIEAAMNLGFALKGKGVLTLLVSDLPPEVTQPQMERKLEQCGLAKCWDFLHVPLGEGYAIINFITPEAVEAFVATWHLSRPFANLGYLNQTRVFPAPGPYQRPEPTVRSLNAEVVPNNSIRTSVCKPPGVFHNLNDDCPSPGGVRGKIQAPFGVGEAENKPFSGVPFRLPPGLTLA